MVDIFSILIAAAMELTSLNVGNDFKQESFYNPVPLVEIQQKMCNGTANCQYIGYVAPPFEQVTYPAEWTKDILEADMEKQSQLMHLVADYLTIKSGKMNPSNSCYDNLSREYDIYQAQKMFLEVENERIRTAEALKLGLSDKAECKSSEEGVMICSSPMSRYNRVSTVKKYDLGKYFTACDPNKPSRNMVDAEKQAPGIVNDYTKTAE